MTHDEVDTGTVVIAKSNNNQSVVDKSAAPHKDFMKQSSSITDILSTISRGNAAKEAVLKSQLMDMKKSAQSESSELDSDTQSIAKP
ncbi:hypothetical protein LDG_7323 [Legionella drancourtii LLAP12]|uniref:Uncharacterized protein n=2 Tax=Legionella drancourtii TaxID=168933 RepID=G9EPY2_9GAMM|nr:hypothetical protein LDG_7323 [Legionella drancourtii LLAP12]